MGRGTRRGLAAAAALLALLATGVVGHRVLAPAETLSSAVRPFPVAQVADTKRIGVLTSAPLILDRRIRVYAEKRRVWADAPATNRAEMSPYWAYRRWPAQLVGVAAVDGAAGRPPVVVTEWSDGEVVALDAGAGRIAWRMRAEATGGGYAGRRTGASTVYEPGGLLLATDRAAGRPVLVLSGRQRVRGLDPWTGERRWEQSFRCVPRDWTTETGYVAAACGGGSGTIDVFDAGTGRQLGTWRDDAGTAAPRPWSCRLGRSGCRLVQTAATRTWRAEADGALAREPHSPGETAFLVGAAYVAGDVDGWVVATDRADGRPLWRSPISGYPVAADAAGVYVVTRDYRLQVLDPVTGRERLRFPLHTVEVGDWRPGHVYLKDGFIAVERLRGRPSDPDGRYYFNAVPFVLAGV